MGVRRSLVVAELRNHQQILILRREPNLRVGPAVRTEQVYEIWERKCVKCLKRSRDAFRKQVRRSL